MSGVHALAVAALVATALVTTATPAKAATTSSDVDALKVQAEMTAEQSGSAQNHLAQVQSAIDAIQARIDQVRALLPSNRQPNTEGARATGASTQSQTAAAASAQAIANPAKAPDGFDDLSSFLSGADAIISHRPLDMMRLLGLELELEDAKAALAGDRLSAASDASTALDAAVQACDAYDEARAAAEAATFTWVETSEYGEGDGLMGSGTASGAVVTTTSMGIAMKTMPLGTVVELSYNGRIVTAVVNDRGPYAGNRQIDLQPAVAHALGFDGVGVVGYRIAA